MLVTVVLELTVRGGDGGVEGGLHAVMGAEEGRGVWGRDGGGGGGVRWYSSLGSVSGIGSFV